MSLTTLALAGSFEELSRVASANHDDGTTTWESVGAIFLHVAVHRTLDLAALKATGFTRSFLLETVALIQDGGWLMSLAFAELVAAHTQHGRDFAGVDKAFENLMVELWENTDPHQLTILQLLREGRLYGGEMQWWIDRENEQVALQFIVPRPLNTFC